MGKWLLLLFVFAIGCSLSLEVGFTWKQAILLAAFVTYGMRALTFAAEKERYTFEPYFVLIRPDWVQILTDYTVLKHDEDRQRFFEWCGGKNPPNDWFTVLRNDKDGLLIYRGEKLGFRTRYDWSYELNEKDRLRRALAPISPDEFPDIDFFVKQKSDVIQLGLNVRSDWWKMVSVNCPKPLAAEEEYMLGQVSIVLAQLPVREFDLYWNETAFDSKKFERTWALVREERKKYEWEEVPQVEGIPSFYQPITIKSKYFEVAHGALN